MFKADIQNYQDMQLRSTQMGNVGLGQVDHQSSVYVKSALWARRTGMASRMEKQVVDH